jgi:peptide/nickel transport system substrate-binding protein
MKRRTFLGSAAAASLSLVAAPALAQRAKVIKFIPLGELAVVDPIRASAKVTLHHSYMVYDTLYGMDESFAIHPQMVEGHSQDGDLVWNLSLREGLRFHDGEPVRGRDVVASIRRWAAADALGSRLLARTDELSAPSDRTIRFRLKQPFPQLPLALGKLQPNMLAIMPERLAATPVTTPLTEVIGSGPFRYVAAERVPGDRVVYGLRVSLGRTGLADCGAEGRERRPCRMARRVGPRDRDGGAVIG